MENEFFFIKENGLKKIKEKLMESSHTAIDFQFIMYR
jgi:hypothetical protein